MDELKALARDAIVLAFSIDRQWFEEESVFEYCADAVSDDLRDIASRADALGVALPDDISAILA